MHIILLAAVGGFTLRGAIQAAVQGDAWTALILGALSVANLAIAAAYKVATR